MDGSRRAAAGGGTALTSKLSYIWMNGAFVLADQIGSPHRCRKEILTWRTECGSSYLRVMCCQTYMTGDVCRDGSGESLGDLGWGFRRWLCMSSGRSRWLNDLSCKCSQITATQ